LPYDSATGSSGPAHQACEYGIPIVCADIDDFRGMATDEGMAVRFYDVGNANHLAEQLIRILRSPALQQQMAAQNFSAGVQMTMTNVIHNYLRWFRLHQAKRAILKDGGFTPSRIPWTIPAHVNGQTNGSIPKSAFISQHQRESVPHLLPEEIDDYLVIDEHPDL
jgi:hypothetical protein